MVFFRMPTRTRHREQEVWWWRWWANLITFWPSWADLLKLLVQRKNRASGETDTIISEWLWHRPQACGFPPPPRGSIHWILWLGKRLTSPVCVMTLLLWFALDFEIEFLGSRSISNYCYCGVNEWVQILMELLHKNTTLLCSSVQYWISYKNNVH